MAHEHLTYEDLLRIVHLIKSAEQFSEFRLKVGDIEVELRRRKPGALPAPPSLVAAESANERAPVANPEVVTAQSSPGEAVTWREGMVLIRAPMIGTFYHAPSPGAPPFVQVGQPVEPDTVVCIIEVMKLMNSITADVDGTVLQILVSDGASVEAQQPLIVLQPRV